MKKENRTVCSTLLLACVLVLVGCPGKQDAQEVQDLNSVRADLRAQVAKGKLTREEAVVKLAEATKEATFGSKAKGRAKKKPLSPELTALGEDLKARVEKGEITDKEAKTAWVEAAAKAKKKATPKTDGNSTKEKE